MVRVLEQLPPRKITSTGRKGFSDTKESSLNIHSSYINVSLTGLFAAAKTACDSKFTSQKAKNICDALRDLVPFVQFKKT